MPIAGQIDKPDRRRNVSIAIALVAQALFVLVSGVLIAGCNLTSSDNQASAPKLIWEYSAPRKSHWSTAGDAQTPSVSGDIVVYAGGYPSRSEVILNAVDLKTGKKLWVTPNTVSKFWISAGTVFYTSTNSMYQVQPGKKKTEWVRAVDLKTGKLRWENKIETFYGNLEFLSDQSYLYLLVNEAQICAMKKDSGDLAWQVQLPSVSNNARYTPARVAAQGDVIFVTMPDHTVEVLDGATGKTKSTIKGLRKLASGKTRDILPVGDLLVLIDSDGVVSTVNGRTAMLTTPVATGAIDSPPGIDESAIYLIASNPLAPATPSSKAPPVTPATNSPPTTGAPPESSKARPLESKSTEPTSASKAPQSSGPGAPAAQRYLCAIALDSETANCKWQANVVGKVTHAPVSIDKMLYIGTADGDGKVMAFDKGTGQLIWTFDSGAISGYPVVDGGVLYVNAKDNLLALDSSTGKLLWKYCPPNSEPAASPLVSGNTLLIVGHDSNLYAMKLQRAPVIKTREATTSENASTTQ